MSMFLAEHHFCRSVLLWFLVTGWWLLGAGWLLIAWGWGGGVPRRGGGVGEHQHLFGCRTRVCSGFSPPLLTSSQCQL